jgi:membrane associated rhomboid family serine protease
MIGRRALGLAAFGPLRCRCYDPAVLPLRDRNPTSRTAVVTIGLIAANVLVFLLWEPTFEPEPRQDAFYFCHALVPYEVTHGTPLAEGGAGARLAISDEFESSRAGRQLQAFLGRECPDKSPYLPLLVSMFLHAGWLHLGGNMLFLWVFGNNVEDRLGRPLYLGFYLIGGLAASALQIALAPSSAVPNLGASGAIAAILGAYLVMYPRARVLTLLFFISPVELPAAIVLGSWFVLQLFSGVGGIGDSVNAGVAYWAHVGGFVAGVVMTYLLLPRGGTKAFTRGPPPRPDRWDI